MTDYRTFDATLERLVPGLRPSVVQAWTMAEGGPADNPLNIGPGYHYGTQQAAGVATANLLESSPAYAGIRNAIKSGNPSLEVAAIKASPWDASHYSNGVLDRTYTQATGGGLQTAPAGGGLQTAPAGGGSSSLASLNSNPLDAFGIFGTVAKPFELIYDFMRQIWNFLTTSSTWIRIGFFVGGAVVLVIALETISGVKAVPVPV